MRVLFVCAGNTCRSPMAGAIARRLLGDTVGVASAGISASDGAPAARNAIEVMAEKGSVIQNHAARAIDKVDVTSFDALVAMDRDVAERLRLPGVDPARIIELDIGDPCGGNVDDYRATADAIERELCRISRDHHWDAPRKNTPTPPRSLKVAFGWAKDIRIPRGWPRPAEQDLVPLTPRRYRRRNWGF